MREEGNRRTGARMTRPGSLLEYHAERFNARMNDEACGKQVRAYALDDRKLVIFADTGEHRARRATSAIAY